MIVFLKEFLIVYLMVFCVMVVHEAIHLFFIKLFKKKIKSIKINLLGGKISYVNDKKHFDILIISIAPNIILPLIGILLYQLDFGIYGTILAFICFLNLVNLLPFTADGSAVIYAVIKMLQKKGIWIDHLKVKEKQDRRI
ncbi:hypothetical protein FIU87_03660 [Bacillus sp. THAF10]|nr:hypothetical protein FIU87_03660 [Bacillus sp. THAF10]